MSNYQLIEKAPTAEEYMKFREIVGWQNSDISATTISIENSLYWVSLFKEDTLIGCGRVIGDGGGLYYYIQDIIVIPEFQKLGLGHQIMEKVMAYIHDNAKPGTFIALMAAKGIDDFYTRYGFEKRPSDKYGAGMCFYMK